MLESGSGATLAIVGADLGWHLFTLAVEEILTILESAAPAPLRSRCGVRIPDRG